MFLNKFYQPLQFNQLNSSSQSPFQQEQILKAEVSVLSFLLYRLAYVV